MSNLGNLILESIANRGISETIKRSRSIVDRYGIIQKKIHSNMRFLSRILKEYDINATIFIPSNILSRNTDILETIDRDRVEIALHGKDHIDYTKLSAEEVSSQLKSAIETFTDNAIKPYGFRAPYLKINKNILKAINDVGMLYDSSYPFYFDTIAKNLPNYPLVEKLIKLYNMRCNNPNVSNIGRVKEIPVALPDDEILVERLNFNQEQVSRCWIDSLKMSLKTNDGIYVMQLHPERIPLLKESLIDTINWAGRNDIKIMSLEDIAQNGTELGGHYMAITGDIDIVRLNDIIWR